MIGRSPTIAAPTPTPAKPSSVIGVFDAHLAELLEQPLRDLVRAVVHADLFPHQEDAVVVVQLLAKRLVQGVAVGEDRHYAVSTYTSSSSASTGGSGLFSAKSQASCTVAAISFSRAVRSASERSPADFIFPSNNAIGSRFR